MINQEIKNLIENNALALATVDVEGNPHCVAAGFVQVVGENKLLITDNYFVETTKNFINKPEVALAVWSRDWEDDCQGYELKGRVEYFKEGEWFEKIKAMSFNEGEPCKGAIVVSVNKIKKLA